MSAIFFASEQRKKDTPARKLIIILRKMKSVCYESEIKAEKSESPMEIEPMPFRKRHVAGCSC